MSGLFSFRAFCTGYYPKDNPMEGGWKNRFDGPLQTLENYLDSKHNELWLDSDGEVMGLKTQDGRADHISVAGDPDIFKHKTWISIPELDQQYGMQLPFRVEDSGDAFADTGTTRLDLCRIDKSHTMKNNEQYWCVAYFP